MNKKGKPAESPEDIQAGPPKSEDFGGEQLEYISEEDGINDKVKKIRRELKNCEQERREYLAGWQRAKADYINLEKRTAQEKSEWIKFSNAEMILKLLLILDSFEEALKHSKDSGLIHIYNQIKDFFKKEGLEEIKSLGEKFNPELHEAVEKIEGKEQGIIVEEIQKGYKLHNKVIRPAKVKVGK